MRKIDQLYFLEILLTGLLTTSCSYSQVPQFNKISAFNYLKKQCNFGPRNPGSEGHRECLRFLVKEFKQTADTVIKQPFIFTNSRNHKTYMLTNIIASFGKKSKRILLSAHWDTRPWADHDPDFKNRNKPILGANDGASGVAVLLEIARIMKQYPPPVGVDIVLFDGEDSGIEGRDETWCVGSRYFAKNKETNYNPQYAILLDMIGDRDLHIPVEANSQKYAPELVQKIWGKARKLNLFPFDPSVKYEIVDDHLELLKVGIPAVDIIDFDYPYWHTLQDTPDKCSPESLWTVGTVLLYLIYE